MIEIDISATAIVRSLGLEVVKGERLVVSKCGRYTDKETTISIKRDERTVYLEVLEGWEETTDRICRNFLVSKLLGEKE